MTCAERYAKLKAEHRCVDCKIQLSASNKFTKCDHCREYDRLYKKRHEINFDKNMAAEFYAELISSVDFARTAKMHNWFDQADGYVSAFRKTLKLLRWFGADTEVETGSSEIRYATIYKDGKRYVIVRDGRVDEPVLLDVIFKFAEEGEA